MIRIAVTKDGDGNQHWSHGNQVDPAQASRVTRAVCDGKHWFLYQHGDEVPAEHQHDVMTAKGAAKKAKK